MRSCLRSFSTLSRFKLPKVTGEPFLHYEVGSTERAALANALKELKASGTQDVPLVIGGQTISTATTVDQVMPTEHGHVLAKVSQAEPEHVEAAIAASQKAKYEWENMPFSDRAMVFRKAADLLAGPWRAKLMAAVMLGTGKNAWQAEIDAAVESVDFLRLNTNFAEDIYDIQPPLNSPNTWNTLEYRPLEGFVMAITPFNFCAIGANLCAAPALMGNTIVWKPSNTAALGQYYIYQIFKEAGLPDGVINFLPGHPSVVGKAVDSPEMAGLHFTGSTATFNHLWRQIGGNLDAYKSYPRVVGETGGKNFHFVHKTADVDHVINCTVRAAFEYSGQKCSACSRLYVPDTLWPQIKAGLVKACSEIKMGGPEDFTNFITAVIDDKSFGKISSYLDQAKQSKDCEVIAGGNYDGSKGYFIEPTIIECKDPHYATMTDELFGPVLSVYVYPEAEYEETLKLCDESVPYGLTGALFASDRLAQNRGAHALRHSAGNFYLNDKSTGAVVGEQPFGGGRKSGTNDKAGSMLNLFRWVSPRLVKENTVPLRRWSYPSNEV